MTKVRLNANFGDQERSKSYISGAFSNLHAPINPPKTLPSSSSFPQTHHPPKSFRLQKLLVAPVPPPPMAKRLIPTLNRVLIEKIVPPSKTNTGILLPEKTTKVRTFFLFLKWYFQLGSIAMARCSIVSERSV